ncbi:complement decay-accelerating factor isoform X2 [Salmo salar]|uniref:Complement decay-accelerating factor isoform X2 n=1 Tax=Salmo salar TaxID=8030 RepID=A0A1S3MZP5_SALSA|nr:complement decay-accelerating factor isoform X2 [Salmo salar]|eukprot:XP_014008652.1 PREDICTED: complement decay-accelerating factor-like isoform X2 [Salmo salar]
MIENESESAKVAATHLDERFATLSHTTSKVRRCILFSCGSVPQRDFTETPLFKHWNSRLQCHAAASPFPPFYHQSVSTQYYVCPPLPQWELTKPLNPTDSYQENYFVRYQCVDGYVRMAGTSSRIRCKRIDQVLQWEGPTLICIPYPSIPTTIEPSTTHKRTPSPIVYPSVPTERISPRPITPSSPILQNPEVITTVTVTTTIIDDLTSVPVDKSSAVTSVFTKTVSPSESYCVSNRAPTSSEDPVGGEGTEKSSATAIYAGVGGVVVTVLLVAAFGVLIFGRRKWMQRLDLSPTPDEIVQINIVT